MGGLDFDCSNHDTINYRSHWLCRIWNSFHIKKKYLPLAAVGGFLSWLVFLLGKEFWGNVFLPTLMAGFVTDVYAEILARICKETSTSFFVTSVIPLIPGSTLYYCMNSIVEGNTVRALEYGRDTFLLLLELQRE